MIINHLFDYRVTCCYNDWSYTSRISAAVAGAVDISRQGIEDAHEGLVQVGLIIVIQISVKISPNGKLLLNTLPCKKVFQNVLYFYLSFRWWPSWNFYAIVKK